MTTSIEVLMQGTKFLFYWSCTVAHYPICICSVINIYGLEVADKRLKTKKKLKSAESAHGQLPEVVGYQRL